MFKEDVTQYCPMCYELAEEKLKLETSLQKIKEIIFPYLQREKEILTAHEYFLTERGQLIKQILEVMKNE